MKQEHLDTLEAMVDDYGLETVLYALGDICAEKAEHLRSNWQDDVSARYWNRRGGRVTRAADAVR